MLEQSARIDLNNMTSFENISICFDLDGTLVDTAQDLIRVLDEIMKDHGHAPTNYDKMRNLVGLGSRAMITQAFQDVGESPPATDIDTIQKRFLKDYENGIALKSRPFAGVDTTLKFLKQHGAKLSICTNKPGYLARPLIKALEMDHYFERIIGSDDVTQKKPSPEHIFIAVGHRKTRPIIMVGDSITDIGAARAACIPCIIMSYGYTTIPVGNLGADRVLRHFRHIPMAVKSLLGLH